MARLNTTVHVYDELGRTTVYLPGDEVDPQHWAQITAPGVWEVEPGPVDDSSDQSDGDGGNSDEESSSDDNDDNASDAGADQAQADDQNDAQDDKPALVIPPKGGPEATRAAWTEYAVKAIEAAGLQIEIPADAKRDDIIQALAGAGIPTE